MSNDAPQFLTVVIRLPDDKESRKAITRDLQLGGSFHGGVVTAWSMEDEITKMEFVEKVCDPHDVQEAQSRADSMSKHYAAFPVDMTPVKHA